MPQASREAMVAKDAIPKGGRQVTGVIGSIGLDSLSMTTTSPANPAFRSGIAALCASCRKGSQRDAGKLKAFAKSSGRAVGLILIGIELMWTCNPDVSLAQSAIQMFRNGVEDTPRATRTYIGSNQASLSRSQYSSSSTSGSADLFDIETTNNVKQVELNGPPIEILDRVSNSSGSSSMKFLIGGFTPGNTEQNAGSIELSTGTLGVNLKVKEDALQGWDSAVPIQVSHQSFVVSSLSISVESESPSFVNSFTSVLFGNDRFSR